MRTAITPSFHLTPMQRAMLFNSLVQPGRGLDLLQTLFTIKEHIDINALQRACLSVIRRHSALRTRFEWDDPNGPVQIVEPDVVAPFTRHDWSGLSTEEIESRLQDFLCADSVRDFDLSKAPLSRFNLFEVAKNEYYLLYTVHHIVVDGFSTPLLIADLLTFYAALLDKRDVDLNPPYAYGDYLRWLKGRDLSQDESFWRQELAKFTVPTRIGIGVSPRAESFHYGAVQIDLPMELSSALHVLGRDRNLSLSTLIHGAWALLLHHYSGEDDIVFGTTRSGRQGSLKGIKSIVGLVMNMQPVRIKVSPEVPLIEWLGYVRQKQRAFRGGYAPLSAIHRWSEIPPGVGLFESVLDFHPHRLEGVLRARGNRWKHWHVRVRPSGVRPGFPLLLTVVADVPLSLELNFDRGCFDSADIQRLLDSFRILLEGMNETPDAPIGSLPYLTATEHDKLTSEWNTTREDYPDCCVHELIEKRAKLEPDRQAVSFGASVVSYRELNQKANQLARHLQKLNVGPDVRVALCMVRSIEMVVGLLGILKAGGAYLPLDPDHPEARLVYLLEDSDVRIVLTQVGMRGRFSQQGLTVICLDHDTQLIARESRANVKVVTRPENLAYVIYTSGSTGKPKGVMVPHRAVVNYLHWSTQYYAMTRGNGAPVHSSISVDLTVTTLWGPLVSGQCVFLLPEDKGVNHFSGLLPKGKKLSLVKLTPTELSLLNERVTGDEMNLATNTLVIGGEQLCGEDVAIWQKHAPKAAIVNEYGPTEATVGCCSFRLPGGKSFTGAIPIGRPIANTQVYILNRHLALAPTGVPGELCIGGVQLARGYLNRPALNAEKFVRVTFGKKSVTRLYRSGDRARYLPDGHIEFLGRFDDQVKIHGFRVELGEIEATLRTHEEVRQVAVILREDDPGKRRLVTYYVLAGAGVITAFQLREYLRERLPEHMIPQYFVEMDALPMTSSGKVSRESLPSPERKVSAATEDAVAPRSPTEQALAEIWQALLRTRPLSVTDNFFEIGGDSLVATQIVSRVRAMFRSTLPLRTLFENPTIRSLASRIDTELTSTAHQRSLARREIVRANRSRPLPLSFSQERMWIVHQIAPDSAAYNIVAGCRLKGRVYSRRLTAAIHTLVQRHESLRTTFPLVDGQPIQVIANDAAGFDVTTVDLTHVPPARREHEAVALAERFAREPFDLNSGPLFRAQTIRLGDENHVLLLVMHHIVSDQWSLGVMGKEIAEVYNASLRNETAALPTMPVQYADFAAWQRRESGDNVQSRQLPYWKKRLRGAPVLDLPIDRPRPAVFSFKGELFVTDLDEELLRELASVSSKHNVTVFMTCLAALQVLLRRYTGQDDIIVGAPIANRTDVKIEHMIGTFVNTLVMRTDLSGSPTFTEVLQRVRETALGAYVHQDLPFETLLDELQPQRDLSRAPLVQVLFNLQNVAMDNFELEGIDWEPLLVNRHAAQFDLCITVDTQLLRKILIEYYADAFNAATIERMATHYIELLRGISQNPDAPISELSMIGESERYQLLREWNATAAPRRPEATVVNLFESQVERRPENVAAIGGEISLTYRQLDARANQLAFELNALGIGPGALVGVLVDRSLDLLVALLGVLKAGAAYLPMDADDPESRLQFVIADSQPAAMVGNEALLKRISRHSDVVVSLESVSDAWPEAPRGRQGNKPQAGDLAYVIYTSGSTGRPKGVEISHRALANFLLAMAECPSLQDEDVMLALTPLSFDISTLELFLPLIVGARVVIVGPEVSRDGMRLAVTLEQDHVTVMQATPATWRLLLEAGWEGQHNLKALCGGEALPRELVSPLLARTSELWNMYGPTETTVWSTCHRVTDPDAPVLIGRPIANTEVYVLDQHRELVPLGVPGELYIGGVGLARGYLKRPDLTAERFVAHPFSQVPGARLYRTGDQVRYQVTGELEYLGRLDNQIKLRGFRIELGEIEAVLSEHPAVREAAATLWAQNPGDQRLVAYIVSAPGQAVTVTALRQHLSTRLPAYMIPQHIIELAALPLTPNGKLDRRALPVIFDPVSVEREYVAPRTEMERCIARIWRDALRIERVGAHDNFFDLGGHSLLSAQVLAQLKRETGVQLTFRAMVLDSLRQIAADCEQARAPANGYTNRRFDTRSE